MTTRLSWPIVERLADEALPDFLSDERAVLVLTGAGPAAAPLLDELEIIRAAGGLPGLRVGTLDISSNGVMLFVAWCDWLADVEALPYVALYRNGRRVDGFAASSGAYLLERLRRLAFVPEREPAIFPERERAAA